MNTTTTALETITFFQNWLAREMESRDLDADFWQAHDFAMGMIQDNPEIWASRSCRDIWNRARELA